MVLGNDISSFCGFFGILVVLLRERINVGIKNMSSQCYDGLTQQLVRTSVLQLYKHFCYIYFLYVTSRVT